MTRKVWWISNKLSVRPHLLDLHKYGNVKRIRLDCFHTKLLQIPIQHSLCDFVIVLGSKQLKIGNEFIFIVGSNPNPHKWSTKCPFEIRENAHLLLINSIENVYQMGILCSIIPALFCTQDFQWNQWVANAHFLLSQMCKLVFWLLMTSVTHATCKWAFIFDRSPTNAFK